MTSDRFVAGRKTRSATADARAKATRDERAAARHDNPATPAANSSAAEGLEIFNLIKSLSPQYLRFLNEGGFLGSSRPPDF